MSNLNLIDNFKLKSIIDESITSFGFLDHVKAQDDISSELAGFQISKLLKNQEENEKKYAELVKKKAKLTKITEKKDLQAVEAEIAHLSVILKESTKKLCKLFKENPDLERDSQKVIRERRSLIAKLEELNEYIKQGNLGKFQGFIRIELENQDQMRRLMEKQKNLNIQIKKLQQQKNLQSKEYQKQISQNQARIQEFKGNLMDKKKTTELEIKYFEKQTKAELSNQKRLYEQSEGILSLEIENIRNAIETEKLVHKELEEYLARKNSEIKKKSDDLTNKSDELKEKFENEIKELNEEIQKTSEQLSIFKDKYQEEEKKKIQREKKEKNKLLQKKQKEQYQIKLNNAIKYIQNQYQLWKDAGGGKKKKKKAVKRT